jgi:hypothetical protein
MPEGLRDRQPVILHEQIGNLPLRRRRYSFSVQKVFDRSVLDARSAYMRLRLAFSALMRLSSEVPTPPYFARQLK